MRSVNDTNSHNFSEKKPWAPGDVIVISAQSVVNRMTSIAHSRMEIPLWEKSWEAACADQFGHTKVGYVKYGERVIVLSVDNSQSVSAMIMAKHAKIGYLHSIDINMFHAASVDDKHSNDV